MKPQSALLALVPEAELLVQAMRRLVDPAAGPGIPAHFTMLFPFRPPATIEGEVRARLRSCLAAHSPLELQLVRLERFTRTLYLAPEPAAPLRALAESLHQAFSDCPPYGGQFSEVIPHLTLADEVEPARLEPLAQEFLRQSGSQLPLTVHLREVTLADNLSGQWRLRQSFPLRGA